MNKIAQRLCASAGFVSIAFLAIAFWLIAGFIPPPSPKAGPQQIAELFEHDRTRILFGMILTMFASTLLAPWAAIITVQLRRIEGRFSVLSFTQLILGTLLVAEFIFLIFYWQTAAYRSDRDPRIVQTLSDMGWIPFVAATSTIVMQALVIGAVMLMDKADDPVFPRWAGYFNLWAGLCLTPGTFVAFFFDGPLAWNGILAFYLPVATFVSWMVVNSILLLRAIGSQADHPRAFDMASLSDDPEFRALANEVAALQVGTSRAGTSRLTSSS